MSASSVFERKLRTRSECPVSAQTNPYDTLQRMSASAQFTLRLRYGAYAPRPKDLKILRSDDPRYCSLRRG